MDIRKAYRAVRLSPYAFGSDLRLLYVPELQQVVPCSPEWADLAARCVGCRTVEEHTAWILQDGAFADPVEVTGAIHTLVQAGLLRAWPDAPHLLEFQHIAAGTSGIGIVGVITADRPEHFRRCLTSLCAVCAAHNRRPQFIVVDGSRQPVCRSRNRSFASEIAAATGHRVTFIGAAEALTIRNALAGVCTDDTFEFALRPGPTGNNRNLILLLAAGGNLLFVDDDVVAEVQTIDSVRHQLVIAGHVEEREIEFFESRSTARGALPSVDIDLLDAHEVLLGRSLHALTAHTSLRADVTHACSHLLEALSSQRHTAIRVTQSGIVGDGATYYPDGLLFSSGKWRQKLASDPLAYARGLKYREVYRLSSDYLVTHEPQCMAYCMGLANSSLTPPFLPISRNQDGLFGSTLSFIDPAALFGHVPYAVFHDSSRAPTYSSQELQSAGETRMSELMGAVMSTFTLSTTTDSPERRLLRLMHLFEDLGGLELQEFITIVSHATVSMRQRQLSQIDGALAAPEKYPPYWRHGLAAYRESLLRNLQNPIFFLPVEFQGASSVDEGFRAVQQFFTSTAGVFRVWPALWAAAEQRRLLNLFGDVTPAVETQRRLGSRYAT